MSNRRQLVGLFATLLIASIFAIPTSAQQHRGYPRYCKTDAGVLGPYNNDSVPEGGACFGTKNGKRYEGVAVYSKDDDSEGSKGGGSDNKKGYPRYCKTDAGVLGPYNNDSVPEGGACFGTKNGKRYEGVAVYSKDDDSDNSSSRSESKKGYPRYCKTDAGVLGPYNNDSVPEGGACFGTKNGKRYEGVAVYSKDE